MCGQQKKVFILTRDYLLSTWVRSASLVSCSLLVRVSVPLSGRPRSSNISDQTVGCIFLDLWAILCSCFCAHWMTFYSQGTTGFHKHRHHDPGGLIVISGHVGFPWQSSESFCYFYAWCHYYLLISNANIKSRPIGSFICVMFIIMGVYDIINSFN